MKKFIHDVMDKIARVWCVRYHTQKDGRPKTGWCYEGKYTCMVCGRKYDSPVWPEYVREQASKPRRPVVMIGSPMRMTHIELASQTDVQRSLHLEKGGPK